MEHGNQISNLLKVLYLFIMFAPRDLVAIDVLNNQLEITVGLQVLHP